MDMILDKCIFLLFYVSMFVSPGCQVIFLKRYCNILSEYKYVLLEKEET